MRTASIMHLPKVAEKVRPPRMFVIDFPLGLTFGQAEDKEMQWKVMNQFLDFALNAGAEEVQKFKE